MLTMASFTFREALHKRVVHAVLALTICFLIVFSLGVGLAFRELRSRDFGSTMALQLTMLGMNAVSMMGALLALFLSVGTISAEVEAGTLYAIVPKPLRRHDILLGKWLGHAAMLSVYVFLLSIAVSSSVALMSGRWPSRIVPASMLLVLQALVLLTISITGTTFLPTIANGVVVFGLYSVAMMSGFMEQVGAVIQNESMVNIGIAVSLLIPSDALMKLSAALLQQEAGYLERVGPFLVVSQPSGWMVVYAVAYSAALLAVATLIFAKRDL